MGWRWLGCQPTASSRPTSASHIACVSFWFSLRKNTPASHASLVRKIVDAFRMQVEPERFFQSLCSLEVVLPEMLIRPICHLALLSSLLLTVAACRQKDAQTAVEKEVLAGSETTESPVAVTNSKASSDSGIASMAAPQDVESARNRLTQLGGSAKFVLRDNRLTEIVVQDGSNLTAEDFALFGRLNDLVKLQIFNCRALNDSMAASLAGLTQLKSLALTNSVINDPTVELIAQSFPRLTELDLSSNTNITRGAMKHIAELVDLQSLTLVQTRFNDLSTRRLKDLQELRSLDLRGNMEAGNMTLGVVGELPKLSAFKHRSTAITDDGMAKLAASQSLQNLLMQDFQITSQSGQYLAQLTQLKQLEIFRCQGFGSDGALELKGLNLERLTLRDLPSVDDYAMELFSDMPKLRRLFLHELDSVTDEGFQQLSALSSLELLDIWSVPQFTDRSVEVLAKLPNLKELSLRSTGITDASIEALLAMPKLQTLTVKENSDVSDKALDRLSSRTWTKLATGR